MPDQKSCPRKIELFEAETDPKGNEKNRRLMQHAQSCEPCQAVLQEFAQEREKFLEARPLWQPGTATTHRRRHHLLWAPAGAALAILLSIFFFSAPDQQTEASIRTKGDVAIRFFVKRGQEVSEGKSGDVFRAGDLIQFMYSSGHYRHLFLISIDSQGLMSSFNHDGSKISMRIDPGNDMVLNHSILLDDTRGLERVFAVFSNEVLDMSQLEQVMAEAFQDMNDSGITLREIEKIPLSFPQATILLVRE